ncbi:MAG: hypothetical protein HYT80_01010, partial [Euryarchaeota archaeon]|nr:hypothetical protein [Euryarchaeota archaeon]
MVGVSVRWACVCLVALLLAGCLDGTTKDNVGKPSATDEPVSETTGAIEVLVVTSEVAPVPGAQVVLNDLDQSKLADEAGRVLFSGLEPRAYTIVAAKAGYRALQPQGKVVSVLPGEIAQAKLVLEPVPVVTSESSYHKSLPFRGFISCSAEWIRVATLVNRTQCGKGVNVGGQTVGADPNENASHRWTIENVQIQTIILEAEWLPTIATL